MIDHPFVKQVVQLDRDTIIGATDEKARVESRYIEDTFKDIATYLLYGILLLCMVLLHFMWKKRNATTHDVVQLVENKTNANRKKGE